MVSPSPCFQPLIGKHVHMVYTLCAIHRNACVKTNDITVVGVTSHHAVNIHLTSVQKPSPVTGAGMSTQKSFKKFVIDFRYVVVKSHRRTCPISTVQISFYPKYRYTQRHIITLIRCFCCDRVDPL